MLAALRSCLSFAAPALNEPCFRVTLGALAFCAGPWAA